MPKPAVAFPPLACPPTFETTISMGDLMDLSASRSDMVRKNILDRVMLKAVGEFSSMDKVMQPLPPGKDGVIVILAIVKHRPETFALVTRDSNKLWHAVYLTPGLGTMTNETIKEADIVDWRPYNFPLNYGRGPSRWFADKGVDSE